MEAMWIVLGILIFMSPLFIALTTMTKDLRDGKNNPEKIPIPRDSRPTPEDGLICSVSSSGNGSAYPMTTAFVGITPLSNPRIGDICFDEDNECLLMYDGQDYLQLELAKPAWPTITPSVKITQCPQCGAPVDQNRKTCPYCGVPYPLE